MKSSIENVLFIHEYIIINNSNVYFSSETMGHIFSFTTKVVIFKIINFCEQCILSCYIGYSFIKSTDQSNQSVKSILNRCKTTFCNTRPMNKNVCRIPFMHAAAEIPYAPPSFGLCACAFQFSTTPSVSGR